jgi:L-glutamine-phosphate cytidylyltransferase
MKAIILAAGVGGRLSPLTDHKPKCLVELAGIPLLCRQINTLRGAGITDITVVAGYLADQIWQISGIRVIRNQKYESTNMVESLFCARQVMTGNEDLIISYGDIVYESKTLSSLLSCKNPVCLTVDRNWKHYWKLRMEDPLKDAETLKLDSAGLVRELGKKPISYEEIEGQYIGLIKVRSDHVKKLDIIHSSMDPKAFYDGKDYWNMYMTSFIQHLIDLGVAVRACPINNGWLEVDTLQDLEIYHKMLEEGTLASYYHMD